MPSPGCGGLAILFLNVFIKFKQKIGDNASGTINNPKGNEGTTPKKRG